MLFELRQYRMKPGKRDAWVSFMETEIIPFQISQGMVIAGSWVGEEEEDLYVWIRRFDSEDGTRAAVQGRVRKRHAGRTTSAPACPSTSNREQSVITRLEPTPKSVLR